MRTVTYSVTMHCASCVLVLEGVEDLPGVSTVRADYRSGTLSVSFDEEIVQEEVIIAAIQESGYQPQKGQTT